MISIQEINRNYETCVTLILSISNPGWSIYKVLFSPLGRKAVKWETLHGFNWQLSVVATSISGLAVIEFSTVFPGTSDI